MKHVMSQIENTCLFQHFNFFFFFGGGGGGGGGGGKVGGLCGCNGRVDGDHYIGFNNWFCNLNIYFYAAAKSLGQQKSRKHQ